MAARTPRTMSLYVKVAALSLATTLFTIGIGSASVAMPTLVRAFGISFVEAQWVVLAYLLTTTSLMISVGRLGDMVGPRRVLLGGLVVFAAGSLACGLAPTFWLVIAGRAVQGIGGAIMITLSLALVSVSVPPDKSGAALGVLGAMSAVGTALGPSVGGLLLALGGWRWVFLCNVPIALLTLLLTLRFLPAGAARGPQSADDRFDIPGTALIGAILTVYVIAMTGEDRSWISTLGLIALALCGTAAFIRSQSLSPHPLIRLSMFHDPAFAVRLALFAIVAMIAVMTLVVTPFYLGGSLSFGDAAIGGVLSIAPVTSAIVGPFVGRAVDRFGSSRIVTTGMMQIAAGFAVIAASTAVYPLAGFILGYVIFGVGYVMFIVANTTAVMGAAEPERRGVVAGMLQLARYIGSISGAAVMGALFGKVSGARDAAAATPDALALGIVVTSGVSVILLLAGIAMHRLMRAKVLIARPGDEHDIAS